MRSRMTRASDIFHLNSFAKPVSLQGWQHTPFRRVLIRFEFLQIGQLIRFELFKLCSVQGPFRNTLVQCSTVNHSTGRMVRYGTVQSPLLHKIRNDVGIAGKIIIDGKIWKHNRFVITFADNVITRLAGIAD